jgi:enamine deaminase RidA (YjgF/YER057c/UK114 family)
MQRTTIDPWAWNEAFGYSQADVVRLDIYTTDMDAYFPVSSAVNDRFESHGNVPVGRILAQVSRLALPPLMVELVATAVR